LPALSSLYDVLHTWSKHLSLLHLTCLFPSNLILKPISASLVHPFSCQTVISVTLITVLTYCHVYS
jgi:hypothetical protein